MALPSDFWHDEQMLNIFRTKRCQRLLRDGVCEWRDHCQFSHNLDWPRRPPLKHRYMPLLCPHLRVVSVGHGASAELRIQNSCNKGVKCARAHSKEEVLYHPQLFKTSVCEEHRNSQSFGFGRGGNRGSRAARPRCHRYYCPFAHGTAELQPSQLSLEQRDQCLRAIEIFPADKCCVVCDPHQLSSTLHRPETGDFSNDAQAMPRSPRPGASPGRSLQSEDVVQANPEQRGSMTTNFAQLCATGCRNSVSNVPCMAAWPWNNQSLMPVTGPRYSAGEVHQQPEVLRACTQQLMIQLDNSPIGSGFHVPSNGACTQLIQLTTVGTPSNTASSPTALQMLPMPSTQPRAQVNFSTAAPAPTGVNPNEFQLVHISTENDPAESQKQPPLREQHLQLHHQQQQQQQQEQQHQQQQQQQHQQCFQPQLQPPFQLHPQAPNSNCICVAPVEGGLRAGLPLQAVMVTPPYWQTPAMGSQTNAASSGFSTPAVPWQQIPPCSGVQWMQAPSCGSSGQLQTGIDIHTMALPEELAAPKNLQ